MVKIKISEKETKQERSEILGSYKGTSKGTRLCWFMINVCKQIDI